MAWVLAQPGITSAIVGASKPEQLDKSLAAVKMTLDSDEMAECNRLWYDLPRPMAAPNSVYVSCLRRPSCGPAPNGEIRICGPARAVPSSTKISFRNAGSVPAPNRKKFSGAPLPPLAAEPRLRPLSAISKPAFIGFLVGGMLTMLFVNIVNLPPAG